ncbi:AMP-binding protein [Vannielia litorea]|uniref:AMP-binding protein n=1 Tax=Vannielia litorea TaxID=1217970 RepID=UPI001C9546CA|nr:AMP-binding protein [Vannielia litorea]MBY6047307.1 AMP-binding protein [Vannielia litorea]MBY6074721.1 AMP-binding protein [Vannielia litorea]
MTEPQAISTEGRAIGEVWEEAVRRFGATEFLVAPGGPALSYAEAAERVDAAAEALAVAGYGAGHRIAVCLGTRPEHFLLKLAMNRLGISFVPINPDYRPGELAYVLEDSAATLIIAAPEHAELAQAAAAEMENPPLFSPFEGDLDLPAAPVAPPGGAITPETEASLLYTSGTTGRPKGCILSHDYELLMGESYLRPRGAMAVTGDDRIFNPLPAFHVNAGVLTFFGVMLAGATLIQPPRFSASRFWEDCAETGATVFHYLGVVISVLMADKAAGPERLGALRAGLGAGVEPALHTGFEARFGIPLVELWGMTEMCRVLSMEEEPRHPHTRAMGRPRADLQVQVWDDAGARVAPGTPGEMVIRHSAATPRRGFFSGYLNKPDATNEAWSGGWFHTGDTVTMDEEGVISFVDRKKNIIRRAGENIAAAEVENTLFAHPAVENVAVLPCPDETREEEVLAAIKLAPGHAPTAETAQAIFTAAFAQLAYYKPPGWILFVDEIPVTGTQKVQKHALFAGGEDPRTRAGIHDLRSLKKRG